MSSKSKMNQRSKSDSIVVTSDTDIRDIFERHTAKIPMAGEKIMSEEKIDSLFVDTSGVGEKWEPALTTSQFRAKVEELLAEHGPMRLGITDRGQFQCHVGVWPLT